MRTRDFWNIVVSEAKAYCEENADVLEEVILKDHDSWHMIAGCCQRPKIILTFLERDNRKWLKQMREKFGLDETDSFVVGYSSLKLRQEIYGTDDILEILKMKSKDGNVKIDIRTSCK